MFLTAQEHYVGFDDLQTTQVDSTEEMKKQNLPLHKHKVPMKLEKLEDGRVEDLF